MWSCATERTTIPYCELAEYNASVLWSVEDYKVICLGTAKAAPGYGTNMCLNLFHCSA